MSFATKHWRSLVTPVAAALVCLASSGAAAPADVSAAREMLARGEYQQAESQLENALTQEPRNADILAALLEAKLAVGKYDEALKQGEAFLKSAANPAVAERSAQAAFEVGSYERAVELVEQIQTPRGNWLRGQIADRNGDKAKARSAYEQVAGIWNQPRVSADNLGFAASAMTKLGRYKDANDTFRDAVKLDPKNALLKAQWGELFLLKHNPADAEGLFTEALQANKNEVRALIGVAELSGSRGDGKMRELLQRALAVNPKSSDTHVLMVRAALEEDQYNDAEKSLLVLEGINKRLLEAWSLRAVLAYLRDDSKGQEDWVARVLKENPHYGEVFSDLGDFSAQKRQLQSAIDFYKRALDLDPEQDETRANLGINLFRLGYEQEARKVLEQAYERDPYNVWTVNTLRLMDSFTKFDNFATAHFTGKLSKKESAILQPYVSDLLEKTYTALSAKYGYVPPRKVTFEMYPDHEDFAVRTVGMPGLGALGATFGTVVTMDSPSARPTGAFHWGSTLWHEVAHVMTLGLSEERVPRWFTEGLSVYEETNARPGWGDPMDPETVDALKHRKLLPLEQLNGAFIHPTWPGQVQFAYFQGWLVCEYIIKQFGFPKVIAMLRSYGQGKDDAETFHNVLGKSMAEMDADFMKFAKERTYGFADALDFKWANPNVSEADFRAEVQKNPGNFFAQQHLAAALLKQSKWEEAIAHAEAAKKLFPIFTSKNSPYEVLADAYEGMGRKDKAAAELQLWREQKGRNPEVFKRLARLQQELGRTADAINTLEDSLNVSMFDLETHNLLGGWYLDSKNNPAAVREFEAVLALNPPDKASAHYNLANAYRAVADDSKAKLEVLAALEIAPGFRPAQKLLLELNGK